MTGRWQKEMPKVSGNYWTFQRYPNEIVGLVIVPVVWDNNVLVSPGEMFVKEFLFWSEKIELPPLPDM